MNYNEQNTLAGKVAWITGSSRGIGKAIAEHFAELSDPAELDSLLETAREKSWQSIGFCKSFCRR